MLPTKYENKLSPLPVLLCKGKSHRENSFYITAMERVSTTLGRQSLGLRVGCLCLISPTLIWVELVELSSKLLHFSTLLWSPSISGTFFIFISPVSANS